MSDHDWGGRAFSVLGLYLSGDALKGLDGEPVRDDSFLLLMNAHWEDARFRLPDGHLGPRWQVALDTAARRPFPTRGRTVAAGRSLNLASRSTVVLRRVG